MDIEQVRAHSLSFPHVTEVVLWGNDLVFKIGGKMFAVIGLDSASDHCLSLVALERFNVLSDKELKELLRGAYDLVLAKLPKKAKAQLG